jgi:hypothetical protein
MDVFMFPFYILFKDEIKVYSSTKVTIHIEGLRLEILFFSMEEMFFTKDNWDAIN